MKIVTAKEMAGFLKLTESTVYKLAAEGKLPAFRIGNSWRFDMDEIMQQIMEAKESGEQKIKGQKGKVSSGERNGG